MKGKITEGRKGKRYFIDNGGFRGYVEVTEAEYEAAYAKALEELPKIDIKTPVMTNSLKGWPRKSLALGVHPDQVQEAQAYYDKLGVPTLFDPKDGKAIVRDNQHQIAIQKARGIRNHDGGYNAVCG